MKKLPYVIYALLAVAVIGLLVFDYWPDRYVEAGDLTKFGVILAGIVLGILKTAGRTRRRVSNKKAAYSRAYGEFIGNAFSDDAKLEQRFYNAVDDYNRNKPAAGIDKLEKLRRECRNSGELYAVTVFQGLCFDDMKLYGQAAERYIAAQQIRPNSTIASNLGICHERMGNYGDAVQCYEQAIRLKPDNAYPYNNLAQLAMRQGDYEQAMEYAGQALERNAKMRQALNAMAVCSYMLGDQAGYESYYRQAVSNGSDGEALKRYIKSLDAGIE